MESMDKKLNILIVTRCYYPHGDATSNVVANFAEALINKGNEVKVLSIASYPEDGNIKIRNGVNVSNYYAAESKLKDQLLRELKDKPFRTGFIIAKKVIIEAVGKINPEFRKLSLNPVLTRLYKRIIGIELKKNKYDLCLITMMPHEAVWAIRALDEKGEIDPPYAVLQYDTYWNQDELPIKYREKRFQYEKKIVKDSLFVMTTPQIVEINTKKDKTLAEKYVKAEFPLVKWQLNNRDVISNTDGNIHCVFLGRLYPVVRPPEKVIHLISMIEDETIRFDFYGPGQELINKSPDYKNASKNIILHGTVSSDEAEGIRLNANVLVNIDNTNLSQVPSKIFDYISTGKPIINFYFDDSSPILPYLGKHPKCLSINVNRIKGIEFVKLLNNFISDLTIDKKQIDGMKTIFFENTPEFVAEQCLDSYYKEFDNILERSI